MNCWAALAVGVVIGLTLWVIAAIGMMVALIRALEKGEG